MSHMPKNCIIVFRHAKHHGPVFLYDEAIQIMCRDTQKVIESLQLHISHQVGP